MKLKDALIAVFKKGKVASVAIHDVLYASDKLCKSIKAKLKLQLVSVMDIAVNQLTEATDYTTADAANYYELIVVVAAKFPINALTTDSFANKLVYCNLDTRELHIYSAGAYAICNMRGITLWDN